jgi:hypothetical protein
VYLRAVGGGAGARMRYGVVNSFIDAPEALDSNAREQTIRVTRVARRAD